MSAHSKIGASSMHRWAACPGSVRESEGMPNIQTPYAAEGTFGHNVAADELEWIFQGKPRTVFAVTEEMRDAIAVYVNAFCESASFTRTSHHKVFIEKKFDLSKKIHKGLFGTSDGIIINEDTRTLEVWDFKYGAGIAVEVEENEQLLYYALGALLETGFKAEWIELVICQPRCEHKDGPIRRWKIPAVRMIDFAADLIEAAKRTEDPNAPLVPGSHCRFCPAVSKCKALEDQALAAAAEEFSPTFSYDPEKLAKTLAMIPTIEAWIKGVEEFAHSEALQGRTPPNYKLVQKTARRKWKPGIDVEALLQLEFGVKKDDLREPSELKSPSQIEKLLKGKDKKLIEQFTVKESSGLTLVHSSDKREPAKPDVLSEFTVITDEKV